ncbi:HAD family hydrolase [Streptacidiphilus jiangxiensis]|uniref:Phosphoglycolate phosphatase n=1 Tax=Streptacidiphilus jiangxiensis TaxID=235985 RepID=A0A1H7F2T8_STRJI|nr:HAD hydrolase-like protein [Streptacidiphilus jiangxiensis]SEK20466.1 phosphoglycolate phosphatase [Streptacidiphilus jiangxiensis]
MTPLTPLPPLAVGFDLDMTLIDSRPGIARAYELLSRETGTPIDSELVVSRLGPPVEIEMAHWFPAEEVASMSDRYRALYAENGVAGVTPLPGALEALAAVRAAGGRTVVVTGKYTPNAKLNLAALDMRVDALHGDVFAAGKAEALRAEGVSVYVGDHLGDVEGARVAGALAVAVATGPYDQESLRAAGADVVLADLTAFPAWLDAHLRDA